MKWLLEVKIAISSMKKEEERRWALSQMRMSPEMLPHLDLTRTTFGITFEFDDRGAAWQRRA